MLHSHIFLNVNLISTNTYWFQYNEQLFLILGWLHPHPTLNAHSALYLPSICPPDCHRLLHSLRQCPAATGEWQLNTLH